MGDRTREPKPLVITVEEAHRFLTPGVASQTIFGAIAREMRKYRVTLLIVDQRPSGIDEEVLSQLGTRFTYLLDNERDVDGVLSGAPGARELRSVLFQTGLTAASIAVRSRFAHAGGDTGLESTGTEESYRDFGFRDAAELRRQVEADSRDLFG